MRNEEIYKNVKWGSYKEYEGPVYIGKYTYELPSNPTFEEKCMFLVSKLEGNIDSINMYDRGIVSVGILQWIESQNLSVSDLVGRVAERCGIDYVKSRLEDALRLSSADFKKNHLGKWRFFVKYQNNKESQVDNPSLQAQCFLSSSGKKGEWSEDQKAHAKAWCAGFASLWDNQEARDVQIEFTLKRMFNWYVTKNAKNIIFCKNDTDGYAAAAKALFFCFSVNIPQKADQYLEMGATGSKNEKYTKEWYFDIFRKIVVDSNVSLWRLRYDRVIKSVNKVFDVEFPPSYNQLLKEDWNKTSRVSLSQALSMHGKNVFSARGIEESVDGMTLDSRKDGSIFLSKKFILFYFGTLGIIASLIKDCLK